MLAFALSRKKNIEGAAQHSALANQDFHGST
jgi:hypothetical protein